MLEEYGTLSAGTTIHGRYIIKNLISKEDSSATYLVDDQSGGRKGSKRPLQASLAGPYNNPFSLKEVILPSKRDLYRFILECQPLLRLDHRALAPIYSLFKDEKRNRAYLLMAFIEGSNLEALRQQQPEQRFSWLETMNILASIISALSYMHSQQPPIVHGEIKPANIIMPKIGGRAVLVGLGSPRECDAIRIITATQSCSSSYRAPEQYDNKTDRCTDIYGLGATFYTLVTGILPANARARLTQVDNQGSDPLQPINEVIPDVPARISRAIDRAMSLDIHHRFSTIGQFWQALWSLVEYPAPLSDSRVIASYYPAVVSIPKQPRKSHGWKFWSFALKQAVMRSSTISAFTPQHTPPLEVTLNKQAVEGLAPVLELSIAEQEVKGSAYLSAAEAFPQVLPPEPAVLEQAVGYSNSTLEIAITKPVIEGNVPTSAVDQSPEEPALESVNDLQAPVLDLRPAVIEQVAEDSVPRSVVEQQPLTLPAETVVPGHAVEESTSMLIADEPSPVLAAGPALTKQVVEESAPVSVIKSQHESLFSEPIVPMQTIEDTAHASAFPFEQVTMSVTHTPGRVPVPRIGYHKGKLARDKNKGFSLTSSHSYGRSNQRVVDLKQHLASRTWKIMIWLLVLISLISLGVSADSSARRLSHRAASVNTRHAVSSFRPMPTSVSTVTPIQRRMYKGTIFDILANVKTSLTITDMQESHGKISGYLRVGPGLLGYGPFKGTIDSTSKHLQFTVTDSDGNPTLFFEGAMQSETNLSGDYYRCNPAQGSPCVRGPVGYGLWDVVLAS